MMRFQLPGESVYATKMELNASNVNKDISLERESHKYILERSQKNGVIDQGKYRKRAS